MADFNLALHKLLVDEGGYVCDPSDPGGATKYGITLNYLKNQKIINPDINKDGVLDYKDIQLLSIQDVTTLYQVGFWLPNSLDGINSQRIANMALGLCVNMGPKKGITLLQQALNHDGAVVSVDGSCGPETIDAINKSNESVLLGAFKDEATDYYNGILSHNPNFSKFIQGWLNRVNSY